MMAPNFGSSTGRTGDHLLSNSNWISLSDYFSTYSNSGVYVIYAAKEGDRVPFYIGQSNNIAGRLGDYARASFKAPTDFRVRSTAELLQQAGYEIVIEIERTAEPRAKENELLEKYKDRPLLNWVDSYDYNTTHEDEYMPVLLEYVQTLIRASSERRTA